MKLNFLRHWKISAGVCVAIFVAYEFSIFLDQTFSSTPLCAKEGTQFYAEWVTNSRFTYLGCFLALSLFILMKFIRSKRRAEILGIYILAFTIVSLTCLSNILSLSNEWGGVCVDAFG